MLEAAVSAGLAAAGADVLRVGVLPTPAVAFLTADYGADLGVVLSASHNPMPDNGIKLFARGGHKLADDLEAEIEASVAAGPTTRPTGAAVGRLRDAIDAHERYLTHLLGGRSAATRRAARRRRRRARRGVAGRARAVPARGRAGHRARHRAGRAQHQRRRRLHPPGRRGGGCRRRGRRPRHRARRRRRPLPGRRRERGRLSTATRSSRCVPWPCASSGALRRDTVVATVMSNLGFHHAMRDAGIAVVTTAVGDRYVLEELRAHDYSLGGEQSGHVVFTDAATTGDGLLTALHVMARMATTGRSLADLAAVVQRLPQTLVNVPVRDRVAVAVVCRGGRGRRRGRRRTRYGRTDPAASVRHGAVGPGDGRGAHPGRRGRRRRSGREGRRVRLTLPADPRSSGRSRDTRGKPAPAVSGSGAADVAGSGAHRAHRADRPHRDRPDQARTGDAPLEAAAPRA